MSFASDTGRYLVNIYHQERVVFGEELALPIEFGRQSTGEQSPYYAAPHPSKVGLRLIVAKATEMKTISRRHVLLIAQSKNVFELRNISETVPVIVEGRLEPLRPGESCTFDLGSYFILGDRTIRIESLSSSISDYASLVEATMAPGKEKDDFGQISIAALREVGPHSENLLRWLRTVVGALQCAATASDFIDVSAKAAKQIGQLDSARVLMRSKGPWKSDSDGWENHRELGLSLRVLTSIAADKRTVWKVPKIDMDLTSGGANMPLNSIAGVQALIAAPILNRAGDVIGVLYGDRRQAGGERPVGETEAMLIEIVAAGLSGGLARLEEEESALTARVLFEQFFTPELSRALEANPSMLQGREAEISVLFCDVRGFSRISERLGPAGTVEWINDVMGTLSDCVTAEEGVLVDYVGDELMAMWGAPHDQPDHAVRACRAAVEMLRALKRVNDKWRDKIGEATKVGIGINTGIAQVGNTGSRQKFKYGPLGNTVNLASRVQTATKAMNASLLITDATYKQIGNEIPARRLHRVKVRNILQTVELYQLVEQTNDDWPDLCRRYESALASYEQGDFDRTLQNLGNLLAQHPLDGPTRMLLSRTTESMRESTDQHDPVWELP